MTKNIIPLEKELSFTRFDLMSEKYPQNTAVLYLGEHFTYKHLKNLSERFAGGLKNLGVRKGDKILLYIPNCIQWVVTYLGIQRAGAVIVPVSPIYTSHEIKYMINNSGAQTIICMDTNFGYVKEIFASTKLKRAIVTNLVDLLPAWKRGLGLLFDKVPNGRVNYNDKILSFKSILKADPLKEDIKIDPVTDLSYILYTGGTTGFPKGVPGNHIGSTSYINDVTYDVAGDHLKEGEDIYIGINPLFHIMALGFFMAIGLNKGNMVVLMPQPQVDAILESMQRYKVRWLLGVPALYRMILENDRLDQYDLSSLAYCFCGGDVLPGKVMNRFKEKYDLPIYQVYGSTEAGHVTYSKIGTEPSSGSSIGYPLKSRECIVMDPVTLECVEDGENGELFVTSPYSMKEYYEKPEETQKTYIKVNNKIYCRMGDYVSCKPDGELVYMERSADVIKHKGYRVSASEIEAVLQDHPTVINACVIGVPDEKTGERIKAIVVLKEDARGVGGVELIRWCSERLASYKVPGYVEFRDMLPKSKVGKLLRREVRDDEKRKIEKKA
ncbi:class I adenylate-forming enzyme family protein [Desulfobacula sp.]|uniref:class I adenylate-forming enzyme family protein n=1 Tax=Desulfobacula sp. TaxID=2593537 RepID=UPI0025C0FB97|nr:AMP-binding protein [Desulfobacula sp.]MBC2704610.1 AMP-binding protein [Desulfobacula sp.]